MNQALQTWDFPLDRSGRFNRCRAQAAATTPAQILRLVAPDAIVARRTQLVFSAVADIGPAPLPAQPRRLDGILVTALGIVDAEMAHDGTPLATVRRCPAVAGDGDQMRDLVRHRGGDEVVRVALGERQVEAQDRCAAALPEALAGRQAAQVKTDLGLGQGHAEAPTKRFALRQTAFDTRDDA